MTKNPYIGPRSFQYGENLYGREEEIAELLDLLIAERIVLLHSPSSAGKTSLIQAALLPKLQKKRFQPLPVMRVSLDPPVIDLPTTGNRFILSLLLSLEESLPSTQQMSVTDLAQLNLTEYLEEHWTILTNQVTSYKVLIIDQFEEILTVEPTHQVIKIDFFNQLGKLLDDRKYWALFAIREEYVAALENYTKPIPTRLTTTFRLNLLNEQAAQEAIQYPARAQQVHFTDAAAVQLVDNLRKVMVQQADGNSIEQLGNVIEPVQLQVVCRRLWEGLPKGVKSIQPEDITAVGDVDSALADYYAEQVAMIAKRNNRGERRIRAWCQEQLITEQGIRGQVLQEPQNSRGLDNDIIWQLVNTHLVRAEKRRGATWFELAHDRLIKPIRKNNLAWQAAHLNVLQRQADLWHKQGRSSGLLLRDAVLVEAQLWGKAHHTELTPVEEDFLQACQSAQVLAEREKQQTRRLRIVATLATLTSVVMFIIAAIAIRVHLQVLAEKNKVLIRDLLYQARLSLETRPQISALLGLEVISRSREVKGEEDRLIESEEILRDALTKVSGTKLPGQTTAVTATALSPNEHWLAIGGEDHLVRLWNLTDKVVQTPLVLTGHTSPLHTLLFSPDNHWLATASQDNTVRLWDMTQVKAQSFVLRGHSATVTCLTFSADGRWLATGSADNTIQLWDITSVTLSTNKPVTPIEVLSGHSSVVIGLSFSTDSSQLISVSLDNTVRLWDVRQPQHEPIISQKHGTSILTAAFDPNLHWVATSRSEAVDLWNIPKFDDSFKPLLYRQIKGMVFSPDKPLLYRQIKGMVFSPDGRWLAVAKDHTEDHTNYSYTVRLLKLEQDTPTDWGILGKDEGRLTSLAFLNERWLATGNNKGIVRLWNLSTVFKKLSFRNFSTPKKFLSVHDRDVTSLSASKRWFVSGSLDKTAQLWHLNHISWASEPVRVLPGNGANEPVGWLTSISRKNIILSNISANSEKFAIATNEDDRDVILIHNLNSFDPSTDLRPLKWPTQSFVKALSLSPDGRWLASSTSSAGMEKDGTSKNEVQLWDLQLPTNSKPIILPGVDDQITTLSFSSSGQSLVISGKGRENVTQVWSRSPTTGSGIVEWIKMTTVKYDSEVLTTLFTDENHLLVGLKDSVVNLVSITSGKTIRKINLFTQQEDTLVSNKLNKILEENSQKTENQANLLALSLSQDGQRAVIQEQIDNIQLWDWTLESEEVAKPVAEFSKKLTLHPITAISLSADGHWLAVGYKEGMIRLFDLRQPNPLDHPVTLSGYSNPILKLIFSQDNRWLISSDTKGIIRIWRVQFNEIVEKACHAIGTAFLIPEELKSLLGESKYQVTCQKFFR